MHMIAGVLQYVAVASFAEAWIEKSALVPTPVPIPSRLLRGGVDWKFKNIVVSFSPSWSPPSRRRGLKNQGRIFHHFWKLVASFAEAWIENVWLLSNTQWIIVASFAEAWIENTLLRTGLGHYIVASFAEAWIENSFVMGENSLPLGVASFAEAWIEKFFASPADQP